MKSTFNKKERLHGYKLIRRLIADGRSFFLFPFRVTWLCPEESLPSRVQVMIRVPKSNFRKAVDRNKIKRRIREAYRLNKQIIQESVSELPHPVIISISYTAKEILPFAIIQEKIILILQRLMKENEKVTW